MRVVRQCPAACTPASDTIIFVALALALDMQQHRRSRLDELPINAYCGVCLWTMHVADPDGDEPGSDRCTDHGGTGVLRRVCHGCARSCWMGAMVCPWPDCRAKLPFVGSCASNKCRLRTTRRCSRCDAVLYCSAECETRDRRRHAPKCKT